MKRAVLVAFAGLSLSACQSSCGYDARTAGRVAQSLGDTGVKLGEDVARAYAKSSVTGAIESGCV